mmetsp:Transcript_97677/g.152715  ORF Transcript_97677/g.152715 Transcript_97677/m.152715 type:complete len:206 (-) Transcript_97677:433-1050(-)
MKVRLVLQLWIPWVSRGFEPFLVKSVLRPLITRTTASDLGFLLHLPEESKLTHLCPQTLWVPCLHFPEALCPPALWLHFLQARLHLAMAFQASSVWAYLFRLLALEKLVLASEKGGHSFLHPSPPSTALSLLSFLSVLFAATVVSRILSCLWVSVPWARNRPSPWQSHLQRLAARPSAAILGLRVLSMSLLDHPHSSASSTPLLS